MDDFKEHVFPHAINEVDHVRNYEVHYSFADGCRELFSHVAKLEEGLALLRGWLKQGNPEADNDILAVATSLCHHGELMLLFQRRLATMPGGEGAYGFLHGKETVERYIDDRSKPPSRYELEQLSDDVDTLLKSFDDAMARDQRFLLDDARELPEELRIDFRIARDLCSVGFEDVALIVCGRGFEKVVRAIMSERKIVVTSGSKPKPASRAMLNDLIGAMSKLRWKDDGASVFSATSITLMHWVRDVRNGAVHEGEEEIAADERATALVLTQVSSSLWATHLKNRDRDLETASV
jgi:hypothetical protein